MKLFKALTAKLQTNLFKNSLWGILSNIFQNILFSVFFIVIARQYETHDFANYIIANTLYSFVAGFSTLGLGSWFIRELMHSEDKKALIDKFLKIQLYLGLVFYVFNVGISFVLYDSSLIRSLSLIIGINVIFDNLIYMIKFMNIAQFEQKKSFVILTVEALLKFLLACLLLIKTVPIIYLSVMLIVLRLVTLNLFIKFGSSNQINIRHILYAKVDRQEIKKIVAANWSFVIIASISVIYWRIGNIIVSKYLTLVDVANYEVSYRLFSMAEILPVIVASSIYPLMINAHKLGLPNMKPIYKNAFLAYAAYGLMAYTFVYSFSDLIIPFLFGDKYLETAAYCNEMFLTILIFPTALIQAHVLLTMKLEKLDMICNVASLVINLLLCFIGLHYFKSLSVINYAIFFSFLAFHLVQDIVLIRRKVTTVLHVTSFYAGSAAIVFGFYFLSDYINKIYLYFIFWAVLALIFAGVFFKWFYKKQVPVINQPEVADPLIP